MQKFTDHPTTDLGFHIYEPTVTNLEADSLRAAIQRLAHARQWAIREPTFEDVIIARGDPTKDQPIRRVGGRLPLFETLPPWGQRLPIDVNREQLAEVEYLIDALCAFSRDQGIAIVFQLNGEDIGWIRNGEPDDLIKVGLIGEWRRHLAANV
jgi:hypothetical protein